jgi:hypothetical protein
MVKLEKQINPKDESKLTQVITDNNLRPST